MKEIIAGDLGGRPHEMPHMLTFPLSKASPGAYSTYKLNVESCLVIYMHAMYCALLVGFLNE
jgi:hypothetical protein